MSSDGDKITKEEFHAIHAVERAALVQRHAEERAALGFEPDEPEQIQAKAPVTISLDIDELLNHLVPDYYGEPNNVRQDILEMAAGKVARGVISADFQHEIKEAVRRSLDTIVLEALQEKYQAVNNYGIATGEPTSLREELLKQAAAHLAESMSPADRYGDSKIKGSVRKFITDEIDRAFASNLKVAADDAKRQVLEAVRQKGAEFMTAAFADTALVVQATMPKPGESILEKVIDTRNPVQSRTT